MLVAVHLWKKDHRAFNVNVNLAAEEVSYPHSFRSDDDTTFHFSFQVLYQAFSLRDVEVAANGEYALFEVSFSFVSLYSLSREHSS